MQEDKGTIQEQDVPVEEEVEEELTEREAAIEKIAAKRYRDLAQEAGEGQDDEPEEDQDDLDGEQESQGDDLENDVGEDAPEGSQEKEKGRRYVELVDENGRKIKIPAAAKYRGKVDGQEFTESFENLTRNYQKEKALSQRLAEAASRIEGIEAREQRVAQVEAALNERARQLQEQHKQEQPEDNEALRKRASKLYQALMDDDEESAVEALAEQLGPDYGRIPMDQEALQRSIDEMVQRRIMEQESVRSAEQIRKERSRADAKFAEEYPDIVADEDLLAIMRTRAAAEMKVNPGQDGLELLRAIGNDLREKFRLPSSDVRTRRQPPQSIPSSNRRVVERAREEKPLTAEEMRRAAIEEIKKARGQTV